MKIFIELESIDEAIEFNRWRDERRKQKTKTPVGQAGLMERTARCLEADGFLFLEDAQAASDGRLLEIPNFGRKALRDLRDAKPNA